MYPVSRRKCFSNQLRTMDRDMPPHNINIKKTRGSRGASSISTVRTRHAAPRLYTTALDAATIGSPHPRHLWRSTVAGVFLRKPQRHFRKVCSLSQAPPAQRPSRLKSVQAAGRERLLYQQIPARAVFACSSCRQLPTGF
jgi:hypothetical protein